MPSDRDQRYSSWNSRRTSRQWRRRRKPARVQRTELRTHLDEVRSRINGCHAFDDVEVSMAPVQPVRRTWGTLSLRDHLAAQDERRSRQSLGSLARAVHEGTYSRAVHSRRVTGVLLAVLGEARPDERTVAGVAVLLGDAMGDPHHELFYMRLRVWLAPYFADHPDLRARLATWLRLQRGDEGERTA